MVWPAIGDGEDMMSPEAKDLIDRLLDMNYKTRLGCRGANDVKNMDFFNGVDWDNLRKEQGPIEFCSQ